jgi:hypothetical protein
MTSAAPPAPAPSLGSAAALSVPGKGTSSGAGSVGAGARGAGAGGGSGTGGGVAGASSAGATGGGGAAGGAGAGSTGGAGVGGTGGVGAGCAMGATLGGGAAGAAPGACASATLGMRQKPALHNRVEAQNLCTVLPAAGALASPARTPSTRLLLARFATRSPNRRLKRTLRSPREKLIGGGPRPASTAARGRGAVHARDPPTRCARTLT